VINVVRGDENCGVSPLQCQKQAQPLDGFCHKTFRAMELGLQSSLGSQILDFNLLLRICHV
jgi:hypothetical protein